MDDGTQRVGVGVDVRAGAGVCVTGRCKSQLELWLKKEQIPERQGTRGGDGYSRRTQARRGKEAVREMGCQCSGSVMPVLTPKQQWYRKAEHRKDCLSQKHDEYFCGPAMGQRCNVVSMAEARHLGSSLETEWLQAFRSCGVET